MFGLSVTEGCHVVSVCDVMVTSGPNTSAAPSLIQLPLVPLTCAFPRHFKSGVKNTFLFAFFFKLMPGELLDIASFCPLPSYIIFRSY